MGVYAECIGYMGCRKHARSCIEEEGGTMVKSQFLECFPS